MLKTLHQVVKKSPKIDLRAFQLIKYDYDSNGKCVPLQLDYCNLKLFGVQVSFK